MHAKCAPISTAEGGNGGKTFSAFLLRFLPASSVASPSQGKTCLAAFHMRARKERAVVVAEVSENEIQTTLVVIIFRYTSWASTVLPACWMWEEEVSRSKQVKKYDFCKTHATLVKCLQVCRENTCWHICLRKRRFRVARKIKKCLNYNFNSLNSILNKINFEIFKTTSHVLKPYIS